MNQKPELNETKSPLNIYEWVQFIKDELKSFEEEKRFLTAKFITIIYTIIILISVLAKLLDNQISYDFNIIGLNKNVVELKVTFAFWILLASFQFYKLLSIAYSSLFHRQILQIINIVKLYDRNDSILLASTIISFIIVLIYRLSPSIFSNPFMPLDILESWRYSILLLILGIGFIGSIYLFFNKVNYDGEISSKGIIILFFLSALDLFGPILLIFWVLKNLDPPPSELLKTQIESGLIIVLILLITEKFAKPFYVKLNEIAGRIEKSRKLIDGILHGENTKPEEIILKRDKYLKD